MISNLITEMAENLKRGFSQDVTQMSNRHMRRCSTSVITREMKIKAIIKYYCLPTRWLMGKKSVLERIWRNWKLCTLWGTV